MGVAASSTSGRSCPRSARRLAHTLATPAGLRGCRFSTRSTGPMTMTRYLYPRKSPHRVLLVRRRPASPRAHPGNGTDRRATPDLAVGSPIDTRGTDLSTTEVTKEETHHELTTTSCAQGARSCRWSGSGVRLESVPAHARTPAVTIPAVPRSHHPGDPPDRRLAGVAREGAGAL